MIIDGEGVVVRVGGHSRAEMLGLLRAAGVQVNEHAETLFAHPAFDDPVSRSMCFVERTLEQLGLPDGAVQSRAFAAARANGLELAPLVAGPYLRLAFIDQRNAPDSVLSAGRPPTAAIHIASQPVSDDAEYPKGFYLRVVDHQIWLRGYRCDDTYVFGPGMRFLFVRPSAAEQG